MLFPPAKKSCHVSGQLVGYHVLTFGIFAFDEILGCFGAAGTTDLQKFLLFAIHLVAVAVAATDFVAGRTVVDSQCFGGVFSTH